LRIPNDDSQVIVPLSLGDMRRLSPRPPFAIAGAAAMRRRVGAMARYGLLAAGPFHSYMSRRSYECRPDALFASKQPN
jgi:hypothetical protein